LPIFCLNFATKFSLGDAAASQHRSVFQQGLGSGGCGLEEDGLAKNFKAPGAGDTSLLEKKA